MTYFIFSLNAMNNMVGTGQHYMFYVRNCAYILYTSSEFLGLRPHFTLEINFEILFRNKNFQIFLSKVSTFTLEINFRKPTSTTLHSMFVSTGRLTNHSAS